MNQYIFLTPKMTQQKKTSRTFPACLWHSQPLKSFLSLLWVWSSCFTCSQQFSEGCLGMKAGPLWRELQGSRAWLFYNLIYNWESCLHQISSLCSTESSSSWKDWRKWLGKMFTFVCVSFFCRTAIRKEGTEMLNYMWQLGNWPRFKIWILRRRTELLVESNEQLSQLVCFV